MQNVALVPRGRELACYVPEGLEWRQINYGQGEGQVGVGGREWGFYLSRAGEMKVVLHSGQLTVEEAIAFVKSVAKKVVGNTAAMEIYLRGDGHESSA
jgi:hypothetical protein